MAILKLENGTVYTELSEISTLLNSLGIEINSWSVGEDPKLRTLLTKDDLDDAEKEQVLQSLDNYFEQLKQTAGYQSRDLMVLHPDTPNIDQLLIKFDQIHTHADDEVRYVIDGEGIFGFVSADGSQMELTMQKEEYINVPANTEHWFRLTPAKSVKAVRYFSDTVNWTPEYTGKKIRI